MKRATRILILVPFFVAAILNMLAFYADRLHLNIQRVAGLAFLFATPWGWLLNRLPASDERFMYLLVLWIPALLYSACIWVACYAAKPRRART